jgi:hypothetical protein
VTERVCKGCGGELPTMHGNRRYCSENCRKRWWDRERGRGVCEICGAVTWKRLKRCPQHAVIHEVAEARRAHIVEMWEAGLLIREIAAELGTTRDSLACEIDRLRKAGRIGYRYKAYEERAA